jgi:D-aminoacyl-tRNA deacylase
MKVVVQRVSSGIVLVAGEQIAGIGRGYVILLGIRQGDTLADARFLADKCSNLRVFEDTAGKMNLSLRDTGGSVIVVSQFTLYADARKGNRPSFILAAHPQEAKPLYEAFVAAMRQSLGETAVQTGTFGAMMEVQIVNDGPVTILIESQGSEVKEE